jgi:hypothetical protein
MTTVNTESNVVVFAANSSPRLIYILNWIFKERLGIDYRLVNKESDIEGLSFFIAYGRTFPGAFNIPDAYLLWEKKVNKHNIAVGEWNGSKTLYSTSGNNYSIPFDIFSAAFFLLSRYEEYYDFKADKHNRYPAIESILHKEGVLRRPILDEWVELFRKELSAHIPVPAKEFSFQPTYDIDIAFSYLYKGRRRTFGGFIRDLLKGNISGVNERLSVSRGKQKDPYDSFGEMSEWHKKYNYNPYFFILASLQTTDFDKNIHPSHPEMQRLIRHMADEGEIGIHPSYHSDKRPEYRQKEKAALEEIAQIHITKSRQHYIKLCLPKTYHALIADGITDDYSMGYGSHLGFRAGTGCSFLWYDLSKEQTTSLRIHPFSFMDTTALYEEKMSCDEAFAALHEMKKLLQNCNSQLITIFHNFSLGSAPEWKCWADAYADFIKR